jgi:N-acetyl sugar amidotransferase
LVLARKDQPKMIKYCIRCFLPDTKPDIYFDQEGLCAACISYDNRKAIDWEKRAQEFSSITNKYKSKDGLNWDCIVPVSGGKDSTAQVIKVLEMGLNPLCVNATTCDLTEIGRENLENIKSLGVDCFVFGPNQVTRAKLNKLSLITVGDISWPEHVGIFTLPVRAAVQFKVPLIIWGENSQNEYGGPASASTKNFLDARWLEEFGGMLGLRVSDLEDLYGFKNSELIAYKYPSDSELSELGVTGLFLGHYFPWDGFNNYFVAQSAGFKSFGKTIEGSIVDYENLDNYQTGIHDYFKFLKFGFGRATDIVSVYLRRGIISRSQGLEMIKKHDGRYPWTYLDKHLDQILKKISMTVDEFDLVCDQFTNKNIFQLDSFGKFVRDDAKNLLKLNYDNN